MFYSVFGTIFWYVDQKHSIQLYQQPPFFARLFNGGENFEYMYCKSTEHRGQRLEKWPGWHLDQLSWKRVAGGMFCTEKEAYKSLPYRWLWQSFAASINHLYFRWWDGNHQRQAMLKLCVMESSQMQLPNSWVLNIFMKISSTLQVQYSVT